MYGILRGLHTILMGVGCTLLLSHCSGGGAGSQMSAAVTQSQSADVCSASTQPGQAMCHAVIRTDVGVSTQTFDRQTQSLRSIEVIPPGYGPQDLAYAYGYSTSGGTGQTIGIVDAYDNPNLESDLAVYRGHFDLPACTTINGCFKKVAQDGTVNFPAGNATWAAESTVDTEVASAVCPNCKIILVEAKSDSIADLGVAVDQAVAQGATVVSNSFGTPEWPDETQYESHWNHPGVIITASTGDLGYGVQFPAASRYVVAVGGTHLQRSPTARGYAETAWSAAGAGCSAYIAKPAWQHDSGCKNRTVADVSFDASPDSPVVVYQSTCGSAVCGWTEFGGTSVAAPAIAGLYALAGNAKAQNSAQALYSAPNGSIGDVVGGSDGSCGVSYLCSAMVGYDGPTGLGTPNGIAAF